MSENSENEHFGQVLEKTFGGTELEDGVK